MRFSGKVKGGKLICDSPTAWSIATHEHEGKRVVVTIEVERQLRSLKANARYWTLLVPLAGDLLGKTRDVPLSKEQVHHVLVSAFLGCDETPLGLVPMRTRVLDSKQFAGYCERVEKWLNENNYPTPKDGVADVE